MIGRVGRGDSRPVNPMHFREGTSCLSLNWNSDSWIKGVALVVEHCWWILYIDFACISCL